MKPKNLENLHLEKIEKIHYNLSYEELREKELKEKNINLSSTDCIIIDTGIFTGRSPKDKYFVDEASSNGNISWGNINKKVSEDIFYELFSIVKDELIGDIYVNDAFCGSSESSRIKIRVYSKIAWQSHFIKNMFILPNNEELENFLPEWTLYNASNISNANFKKHKLNSEAFVVFHMQKKIIIIGGTSYTGEMKKGFFSVMNYILPLKNNLSMHCSASTGKLGDTCLFFGLSGTGKTTLSADPKRKLIGDDEHGWDDSGIFNIEGGCYAKVINLSKENEPDIYEAIKTNALLENVIINGNGVVDYEDKSKTENTRVSYPINHIKNYEKTLQGGHPKNIIFLTADAFGVLPPISKLDSNQAMYYYLSGYTSKLAGTERGIIEPEAVFSACFGEAFLPLNPVVYAKLLKEKIQKYNTNIYLVNSGWTGGAYGVGHRISIKDTRACVDSILSGEILKQEFKTMDIFNLMIPIHIDGVKDDVLNPRNQWEDKSLYDKSLNKLAKMFIDNFERYKNDSDILVSKYGPIIK